MTTPASAQTGKQDERCTTCNGRVWSVQRAESVATRETVGMVCQTCGTDYGPPAPSAGQDTERLRDEMRDEIAGSPVGSGYYQSKIDVDEARDIADALLDGPLRQLIAERDQARRSARQAWDVHSEHVDRMNVLLLQAQAERDQARAQVQRVRELPQQLLDDRYDSGTDHGYGYSDGLEEAATRIRELLAEESA